MKATFTDYPSVAGDYLVIYGSTTVDYLLFICPCGECTEPVIYNDMSGIVWSGVNEFPTISKIVACPEGRWIGRLDSVVGDFIDG